MTEENILAIGSTAQDLKRVAHYIGRGSSEAASRFLREAIKNCQSINQSSTPPYILKYIRVIKELPKLNDPLELAEQSLTIGTIFQNVVVAARTGLISPSRSRSKIFRTKDTIL